MKGVVQRVRRSGWYLLGPAMMIAVSVGASRGELRHAASTDEFHNIAWPYVTLVIAVVSLLYPLALQLRDSLTSRLFAAFEALRQCKKWTSAVVDEQDTDYRLFKERVLGPVATFRTRIFDQQLPFLIGFSAATVLRVLTCMIGLGPLPVSQQIIEPQLFVAVYLLWAGWVTVTVLQLRPFWAVETALAIGIGSPLIESRVQSPRDAAFVDMYLRGHDQQPTSGLPTGMEEEHRAVASAGEVQPAAPFASTEPGGGVAPEHAASEQGTKDIDSKS
jgi:hypothetical protein